MTGSWGGRPRFSASLAIQAASCSLRGVVARIGVADRAHVDRARGDVRRRGGAAAPGRAAAATCAGCAGGRLRIERREQPGVAAARAPAAAVFAARGARSPRRGRTRATGPSAAARPAARRGRDAGRGRARRRGRRDGRRRGRVGAQAGGRLPVGADLGLEPDVDVVLVRGVGEVARAADRERRADLVAADRRRSNSESSEATSRARALPGLTISPSIEAMSRPRP